MKKALISLAIASAAVTGATAFAPAAIAQSRDAQARWDAAQARFDRERSIYERERQIYQDAQARWNDRRGYRDSYRDGPPPPPPGNFSTDYDASRYYRDDPRYQERTLSSNDQVYRGSDGRYYCKRNDGTTGLIVGGATGAILGNVIDGGHQRAAGTLIGGALGAILGKSVDQNSQPVRCR